jgi:hypothetical protein
MTVLSRKVTDGFYLVPVKKRTGEKCHPSKESRNLNWGDRGHVRVREVEHRLKAACTEQRPAPKEKEKFEPSAKSSPACR